MIITFFVFVFVKAGDQLLGNLGSTAAADGWAASGFKYGVYNIAILPLLLYIARDFQSRSEAFGSGFVAAAIALAPGLLFHFAFFAGYPQILEQPVPVYWLMQELGLSFLVLAYSLMLFGTFIETGAGLLQGINERVDVFLQEAGRKALPRLGHAGIAVVAVVVSALLSLAGITTLIAKGYGTMAWAFFAVYIIPLVTLGAYRVFRKPQV
jgi:uncharacterized membrane protein YkvI